MNGDHILLIVFNILFLILFGSIIIPSASTWNRVLYVIYSIFFITITVFITMNT